NPTQDILILELNSLIDNEIPISFFNMQGKMMLQIGQRLTKGLNIIPLHTESLQTGAYLMQVPQTSDKNGLIPFIKK
ncbi:MAG: Secretion system C-terminal sorting domain, partial [Bacteroidota bacterium]